MRRNNPTRVVETGRVVRGPSGQGVGWLQPIEERVRNLLAQVQGLRERINTPLRDGVPGAVCGELTFKADTTRTLTLTDYPIEPDSSPIVTDTLLVNPIFFAGQTYKIPVMFPPPGVFLAHNLVVGIEAGFTMFADQPRMGITPLADYRQVIGTQAFANVGGFVPNPTGDAVIRFTTQQQILGEFTKVMPFIPYFWNIIDEKSGRQYAQSWMPHGALLNTRGQAADDQGVLYSDSDLFEFDTPWIFERDAQVTFLFRPIMDLYQLSASETVLPYGDGAGEDDRSGGRRVEQATVRVEFHGNRYYRDQDLLKDGAFVTR